MELRTFDKVLEYLFSDCEFYVVHFQKLIKGEKMSPLLKVYMNDDRQITFSTEGYIIISSSLYEEPSNRIMFMSSLINMNRAFLSSYK